MACTLKAIVAVTDDWGIGKDGGMVVANRADMRHFVECTTGHAVIMGRKTLESFPGGRPLKNRRNIVLSANPDFSCAGAEVVHSVEEALAAVAGDEEAWVIGGGVVYLLFLPYCRLVEVTKNHCVRDVDTYFATLDGNEAWELQGTSGIKTIAEGEGDTGVEYEFCTYVRRDPSHARRHLSHPEGCRHAG